MLHYRSMVRNKFEKRNQVVSRFCQKVTYIFHKITEYSRHQEMIKESLFNLAQFSHVTKYEISFFYLISLEVLNKLFPYIPFP